MLSRHFAMNFVRSLALSPAGSAARRSAALRRKTFVGTWRCCWRLRLRNCLKASWSEGPSLSSASSSWQLAAISARGAMGCGQPTSESDEGQAAPRRQSDGYGLPCAKTGLPCDTGTDCRPAPGKYPTTLAEPPRSQRYTGPPAGRSGWVDACSSGQPAPKLAA